MLEIFNQKLVNQFIDEERSEIAREINRLTNKEIYNLDIDELKQYYYENKKINLIEIYSEEISKIYEINKKKDDPFHRSNNYVAGYRVILEIPFEGDIDLLFLVPNRRIMHTTFIIDNIIKATDSELGKIIFSLEYEKEVLNNNKENVKQLVKEEFKNKFSNYLTMIQYINDDIEEFNNGLNKEIDKLLEERYKNAKDYMEIREKLNIPLELDPKAPNLKPILLKKKKEKIPFPNTTKTKKELDYCISDSDYNNIKNIIDLMCVSMEKTARTFNKLYEEELRDIILSALNTHYKSAATGETFNKTGKVDIHIPFENKSAYIAECKIWHGEKKFLEAIDQLFGYTRWRDTKTSLIIFNKEIKDFMKILDTIGSTLENYNLCIDQIRISKNKWQCVFQKSKESSEKVEVHIVVYNLNK